MSVKTALVIGVANNRSLAWSSALSLLRRTPIQHVVVTYQNERFRSKVERMVKDQNALLHQNNAGKLQQSKTISCLPCDVSCENSIQLLFHDILPSLLHDHHQTNLSHDPDTVTPALQQYSPQIDAMVHSVAYAPTTAMKPLSNTDSYLPLLSTTREDFEVTHSISSYSLIALSKHALPLLSCQNDDMSDQQRSTRSPSITALTYLGAQRVVPNYNIMGPAKASLESLIRGLAMELGAPPHKIRVNGVSAGPVNTLAARGITNFMTLKDKVNNEGSFLKRGVNGDEVGNVVAFLSDGESSSGVTGQIVFCDAGFSAFGGVL